MDIRELLLKGLSSTEPIVGCRRFFLREVCFSIHFVVIGKFLKITKIRRTLKRRQTTLRQHIKRYHHSIKLSNERKLKQNSSKANIKQASVENDDDGISQYRKIVLQRSEVERINIDNKAKVISTALQTIAIQKVQFKNVATETERISLKTTAEQTDPIDVNFSSKSSQTEYHESANIGLQCENSTTQKCSQTDDVVMASIATQVGLKLAENISLNDNESDNGPLLYVLNEIGELVLTQNRMLCDNTKMLHEISRKFKPSIWEKFKR
ncbi:uncharacterized protein LOC131994246 [Stomoxys calcitrans]|uniref:uncharacterized protein LOC131994246 n=1 Tax=Stomoxys calcitrans TaxID=35570 RepID=UPI0027E2A882|nr:uncharacterized protein LOC131994246 [Stomoxys calcitrans]